MKPFVRARFEFNFFLEQKEKTWKCKIKKKTSSRGWFYVEILLLRILRADFIVADFITADLTVGNF